MTGCKDGRCGTRINPQVRQPNVSSSSLHDTPKSYKGSLYYPTLEVVLVTNAGVQVEGHIRMKTGVWGILCSEEGDTTRLSGSMPGASPSPGYFSADMRRGLVTIEVTKARCGLGFFLRDKKVRKVHWRKEKLQITWDKSEIRYD